MDSESIRSEIAFRFSRSSGPGGQHAQKTETRVEALLDVEASSALTVAQKQSLTQIYETFRRENARAAEEE